MHTVKCTSPLCHLVSFCVASISHKARSGSLGRPYAAGVAGVAALIDELGIEAWLSLSQMAGNCFLAFRGATRGPSNATTCTFVFQLCSLPAETGRY